MRREGPCAARTALAAEAASPLQRLEECSCAKVRHTSTEESGSSLKLRARRESSVLARRLWPALSHSARGVEWVVAHRLRLRQVARSRCLLIARARLCAGRGARRLCQGAALAGGIGKL